MSPSLLDLTGRPLPWPEDLRRRWILALSQACSDSATAATAPWRGVPALRASLETLLDADSPYVTAGVRAVIPAFALLGREVIIERPSYDGVRRAFERCGATVRCHRLDTALDVARPAANYLLWITSPGRNPDGWALDATMAQRLGEFVSAGGIVVQNETYRLFCAGGHRVPGAHLVGSFNKLAGGWARTGWLVGDPLGPLAAYLRAATPPTPWQAAWARFAEAGGLDDLMSRARRIGALTAGAATRIAEAGRPGPANPVGASLLVVLAGDPVGRLRDEAGILAGPGPAFDAPADRARLSFLGCGAQCDHTALLDLIRTRLGGTLHLPTA